MPEAHSGGILLGITNDAPFMQIWKLPCTVANSGTISSVSIELLYTENGPLSASGVIKIVEGWENWLGK